MALEDIELVENVTNLKSPFEKILICTSIYHKNERKVSFPSYKTVWKSFAKKNMLSASHQQVSFWCRVQNFQFCSWWQWMFPLAILWFSWQSLLKNSSVPIDLFSLADSSETKTQMIFQISLMQYVNCVQNFVVCCFMFRYIKQHAKHLIYVPWFWASNLSRSAKRLWSN